VASQTKLRFDQEDVAAFARASGDVNPLHVDSQFGRGSPFGGCVVHGSLLGIGMLGHLPDEVLAGARFLDLSFSAPLLVGETGHVEVRSDGDRWTVELTGRGKPLARLRISPEDKPRAPSTAESPHEEQPMREVPAATDLAAVAAFAVLYRSAPELEVLAQRFGAGAIERRLLRGMAWASYVVGMEVPGMHGLLGGFSLALGAADGSAGVARIQDVDARTGRIVLESTLDGVGASIECFAREATHSLDVEALRPADRAQRVDEAVVVVGASRGLGAALALAFLLRGFEVHAVYSTSTEAADELKRLAGGDADRLHLHRTDAASASDLKELVSDLRARQLPLRGLVLAAALPPLGMGLSSTSAFELARYVGASVELVAAPLGALMPLLDESWVVFCSSAALSSPPREWPHYVAAKGAIEGLGAWLAAAAPGVASVVVRPPKLQTEMTNTPAGRIGAVPVEPVARWLAERVASLPPGLVTLEPPA
jgi:NAD(P)-dependent dehydrogenase (short-subunit alcohol dehydrogenase family)